MPSGHIGIIDIIVFGQASKYREVALQFGQRFIADYKVLALPIRFPSLHYFTATFFNPVSH
jgi:hypothetical protein